MLVTCRPSKPDIAGEQSVKNKKGNEIRVNKTLQTGRSYNADDTQGFPTVITFFFFLNAFCNMAAVQYNLTVQPTEYV
jgi:hypothetical protein